MKVLVSDFDNTFYSSIFEYDKNIEAVRRFVEHGNMFVIASSRNLDNLLGDLKGYQIPYSYLICLDGAMIMNDALEVVYRKDIDPSAVKLIFERLDQERSIHETWIDTGDGYSIDSLMPANSIVARPTSYVKASSLLGEILDDFPMVHGYIGEQWLRIYDKDVNKGNAIAYLENQLHVLHDDIYTVGGSLNDLSMLSRYRGYAMEGASNDVKKVCIGVVSSVHELIDQIENKKTD